VLGTRQKALYQTMIPMKKGRRYLHQQQEDKREPEPLLCVVAEDVPGFNLLWIPTTRLLEVEADLVDQAVADANVFFSNNCLFL
jgi:hypothetical protein